MSIAFYYYFFTAYGMMASIDIESEVLQSLGQIRFAICGLLKIANLQSYKAKIWYRRYVSPPSEDESSTDDDDENSTTDSQGKERQKFFFEFPALFILQMWKSRAGKSGKI